MVESAPDRPPPERSELHEHRDVRIGPLKLAAIGVVVGAVVIHLALYWLFGRFQRSEEERDRSAVSTALPGGRPAAPEPRLQGIPGFHPRNPREDLERMREEEERLLRSYGATTEEGVVRIPVDRAMELILERGLPRWKGAGGPPGEKRP
jgi:hypothetical protein